ncbi:hypothetical protein HDV64DRAFT_245988 [Trichoderma sp. TUCIM 5745]
MLSLFSTLVFQFSSVQPIQFFASWRCCLGIFVLFLLVFSSHKRRTSRDMDTVLRLPIREIVGEGQLGQQVA